MTYSHIRLLTYSLKFPIALLPYCLYNKCMAIIRRLNCFDAPKIKKMIAYLGNNEKISGDIMAEAFILTLLINQEVMSVRCL